MSCGRSHTVKPKLAAYCSARCKTCVSSSGTSAWLKPTQPASVSCTMGVSAVPRRPRVSAPSGKTRDWCSFSARNLSISTRPGSSSTGSVSGGQTKLVTPPATAAASSLSSMPSCSWPGSRRRTDKSTSPGATTQPLASMVLLGAKSAGTAPMLTMRPAAIARSATWSNPLAGLMTRPFLMRSFMIHSRRRCS